jgi:folate-binding protein YgfZ
MEPILLPPIEQDYQQALESVLILERPKPAIFHVTGPDSIDLLNRMSTNDLSDLAVGPPVTTVFTNAHARIIDVATVIPAGGALLLLCWHDTHTHLKDWLSGYIFFQDDVRLMESSHEWNLFDFIGPDATGMLELLTGIKIESENGSHAPENGLAWSDQFGVLPRVRLLCHGELADQVKSPPPEHPRPVSRKEIAEILRIEAGVPALGTEITEDSIPLEVGLWNHVSFSKGCYIGQEIIARMESRGKLAWRLFGIRSGGEVAPGTVIYAGDRSIGRITSSAHSPRFGWIGLASVKPGSWDSAMKLSAGDDSPIEILPLPFK